MASDSHNPTPPENGSSTSHGEDDIPEVMRDLPVVPHHVNKEVFQTSWKALVVLLLALLAIGTPLAYLIADMPGVWGALMGVGITLLFSGTTIWSMLYTADKEPNMTMAVVMGAWLAKMLVFLILLAVLRDMEFYHRVIFAIVMLIGIMGSAILDMWAVSKGRTPYVTPLK